MSDPIKSNFPRPFQNMAISLSGGGYRATAYHLGSMSYLDSKGYGDSTLLQNVETISTISGGTITGAMYALILARDESFQDCFNTLYKLLEEDRLVVNALEKLKYPTTWRNNHKSRDVINAFSEVYNEEFYDGATFRDLENGTGHLKNIIFGASEFTRGLQFRFIKDDGQARFGNGAILLNDQVSPFIRLADAVASSSCFPGGFEPMIMPKDYGNGPLSQVDKYWNKQESTLYQATGIMDGGIIDNQGIEGVKGVDERNERKEDRALCGTYIISDVAGREIDPYTVPLLEQSGLYNWLSLNVINTAGILILALCSYLIVCSTNIGIRLLASSVITILLLWFLLYMIARNKIVKAVKSSFGVKHSPEVLHNFKFIRSIPLYMLAYYLKFRITSVIKMVSEIFLHRIRSLQISSLFDDSKWRYRIQTNDIYVLLEDIDKKSAMAKVIKTANSMPTTLWFSASDKQAKMLDNLIACGQINLCYNLLEYIKKIEKLQSNDKEDKNEPAKNLWNMLSNSEREEIGKLKQSLETDWSNFQTTPMGLLEHYKGIRLVKG